MRGVAALALAAGLVLAGCSNGERVHREDRPPVAVPSSVKAQRATPSPSSSATRRPSPTPEPDPRWVFYTDDRRPQRSPWYAGAHPVMIPFGCTPAPYYDPDPACTGGQGIHHGIDVAMPCGTPLLAARPAEVLANASLGSAYGSNPVLLRVDGQDVVIGHTTRVYVEPGDTVEQGERFALAGDSGAPDGCHLHFEVRPAGGSYLEAVDPAPLLSLRVRGGP